jgi:hypothetical protein
MIRYANSVIHPMRFAISAIQLAEVLAGLPQTKSSDSLFLLTVPGGWRDQVKNTTTIKETKASDHRTGPIMWVTAGLGSGGLTHEADHRTLAPRHPLCRFSLLLSLPDPFDILVRSCRQESRKGHQFEDLGDLRLIGDHSARLRAAPKRVLKSSRSAIPRVLIIEK